RFLEKYNIKYIEKDVSKNHNAAQELMNKSGQAGVPVVIIGDTVIVGYDEEAMKKALKIK
ncbi:MAG: glutaredoxin domain-containing protein, partial [Candidatus Woesearchaeota archaeon]